MGIFDMILYKGDKEKELIKEKEHIENDLEEDDFRYPETYVSIEESE